MTAVRCIHGMSGPCPCCATVADKLEPPPLSQERASIVAYLEWAARMEVGTVLSREERQGVGYAAAWVRNCLDLREWLADAVRVLTAPETQRDAPVTEPKLCTRHLDLGESVPATHGELCDSCHTSAGEAQDGRAAEEMY